MKHHPQAQFTWQDAREAEMNCGLIYQFKGLALWSRQKVINWTELLTTNLSQVKTFNFDSA